jgi:hypothetical protein
MPLRWLRLSLRRDDNEAEPKESGSRYNICGDTTHLRGIHATAALALATTLESLHLAILLHEHRLCVWSPAYPHAYAYVWRHAANGT